MRIPLAWLREYCDPGLTAEALAERLSMSGTDVERIEAVGAPSPEGFVVGRVLAVESHPNADRLSVCEVDAGGGSRTIVCGAPNVAAGQSVAVALPGATLPGGVELGEATLRGVASEGMILSEAELGIGDDAAGIMVLAEAVTGREGASAAAPPDPGTPLEGVLEFRDHVLELEVTPNRPDCLGVYGVAREVHAVTGAALAAAPWEGDAEAAGEGEAGDCASVRVEVPELCPRFTVRVFTGVRVGPSPPWLKARLAAAGQRSINNVVDISNYVMLLTSQPLHAFDLDRVPDGALIVRTASAGERLTTLDGVDRVLDASSVLVCDREAPAAIAGIMGGQGSEVSAETTRVLLEVATWSGVNILRTSTVLGLRSEASTRFEKQLHPELAMRAQRIASRLLVELCGARLVPGTIDVATDPPPPRRLLLRGARIEGLLGMRVPPGDAESYLERLGFAVERTGEGDAMEVEVPPDRYEDVRREVDLIEEVARVHGLDEHLPTTLPRGGNRSGRLVRHQALRRRAEDELRDLGFDEVVAWSFSDAAIADRLRLDDDDPRRTPVAIHNPLSGEGSVMRTTLLGGLLDAARHNLARGAERALLFESGRVYLRDPAPTTGGPPAGEFPGARPAPVAEPHRLGCLAVGAIAPPSWRVGGSGAPGAGEFFELKGVLEDLCRALGTTPRLVPSEEPFLHPGRAAAIELDGRAAGWIGELHPLVAAEWDLPGGVGFEVGLAALLAAASLGDERFEELPTFPAIHQDLAVVVPEGVAARRLTAAVEAGGGELLRAVRVFDLYAGEQVGEGNKSLALRLEFRAPDRTLTDEEVAERREAIRAAVEEIGGAIRE